jgi:hypothetical protein
MTVGMPIHYVCIVDGKTCTQIVNLMLAGSFVWSINGKMTTDKDNSFKIRCMVLKRTFELKSVRQSGSLLLLLWCLCLLGRLGLLW